MNEVTENTTKVIKLSNGEDIVCTCMKSHNTDEASPILYIAQPLKMQIKNKVTKKGVVEALTLSRWLQPFTVDENYQLERSNIVAISDASYALNNYYQFMLNAISESPDNLPQNEDIKLKQRFESPEDIEAADAEVRELFDKYVDALSSGGKKIDKKDRIKEEIKDEIMSDEDFDSLPISDTKH
jgi:hypothetical protein